MNTNEIKIAIEHYMDTSLAMIGLSLKRGDQRIAEIYRSQLVRGLQGQEGNSFAKRCLDLILKSPFKSPGDVNFFYDKYRTLLSGEQT